MSCTAFERYSPVEGGQRVLDSVVLAPKTFVMLKNETVSLPLPTAHETLYIILMYSRCSAQATSRVQAHAPA